jgi:beta-glucanase (GH16 family)
MHQFTAFFVLLTALALFACQKDEPRGAVPSIQFPINVSAFENEANAIFEFPLVMDVSTNREVTVTYEVKPLTATVGEDFIATAGSLVFPAGTASGTIEVEIVGDEFKEEDEQFRVVLTGSTNAVLAGGLQEAIGTIRNDDTAIQVTANGYDAANSYPGRELVWSDEFEGEQIDPQNWTYDLGASGWGNQELQNYTSSNENSYVAFGNLMIVAKENGAQYTSARLKSIGLQEFQFGRIDVRAVLPFGQGIWPAIWMLGGNFPSTGWPACGEIDIMELIGSNPSNIHGTVHYGNSYAQHQHTGGSRYLSSGQTFADEFHVFSIEWDEEGITWLLDDQPFFSVGNNVSGNQNYPFDNPFFFILNVAVGGQWPGYPNATTTFPQYMAVDYVRVYQ